MTLQNGRKVGLAEWTARMLWKAFTGTLRAIGRYCRDHYPLRFE